MNFRLNSFLAFHEVNISGFESVYFVLGYRSDNFIVGLTDVSPATTAPILWNYDLCAQYPGVVGEGATVYLPCTSEMPPRRYVVIQTEVVNEYMNFCEIEVYVSRKLVSLLMYSLTTEHCQSNSMTTLIVLEL